MEEEEDGGVKRAVRWELWRQRPASEGYNREQDSVVIGWVSAIKHVMEKRKRKRKNEEKKKTNKKTWLPR
jgi:hypothetical protein